MKHRKEFLMAAGILLALTMTGCGSSSGSSSKVSSGTSVNQVVDQQMAAADTENADTASGEPDSMDETSGSGNGDDAAETSAAGNADSTNEASGSGNGDDAAETSAAGNADSTNEASGSGNAVEVASSAADDVDYDLTAMSSDMVYATVYQMMSDPDTYEGKSFRMEGLYYASYYEPTEQYYHYCIIQDATACCAQGLEFVWGDGSHVYPDEYPEDETEVVIQGVFETYMDEGDDNLYCHLKDATLRVK